MNDEIVIKGAREHNLKNIDLTIPRDKLVVITGLSGSGKSSLAFDTIYAEGQRRYVESLSAYARQFLEQMDKPDVDLIEGLSPAIAIEQKTTSKNPRSTVGTVTEIHDYLRLLFARVGQPSCHKCGKPITAQTVSQIVDQVMALPEKTRIMVLAPVVRGRKGEYKSLLAGFVREGFVRVRVNGKLHELTEEIELKKHYKHNIDLVVDRLVIKRGIEKRLADSIETSLKQADGIVSIPVLGGEERLYSEKLACIDCGVSYPEISPRSFSFNNPHGACPDCTGLGEKIEIDPELVIPDPRRSISNGAVIAWDGMGGGIDTLYMQKLEAAAAYFRIGLTTPVYQLPPEQQRIILYGSPQKIKFNIKSKESGNKWEWNGIFEGVIPNLERRYKQTSSHAIRTRIHRYMRSRPCPACGGRRLRPESLSIKLGNLDISQVCALSIDKGVRFFQSLELDRNQALIARQVLKEINDRLGFLISVGLDYLTLDRQSGTLSGGEAERIRLATQIGSRLTGVLYILDEPSIGLHQRDNNRLLKTLESLRQMGNSVLVVEHDGETMKAADYLVDMGPEAGIHGGEVVSQGTPQEIMADNASVTGRYLSGKKRIEIPSKRRKPTKDSIRILGASENNLKNIDVTIPLGLFSCLTGVSGSGKSSLAVNTLYPKLMNHIYHSSRKTGKHQEISGIEQIDKVIDIDQSPIGRTPRSNPATYTGLFSEIRDLLSKTPEARIRGYKPGRFSFNVKGGRCQACRGDGLIKIEMHFLADLYVTCEECRGKRYNRETLEVKYKGKNIAEILKMTVDEALGFYRHYPVIFRRLKTLSDVGLGYIELGQYATTLSGGEAQRLKLSRELGKKSTGRTLYILDEPTTGLHFADVDKLLKVLHRLVEAGNTVLVIEHNLDVIKCADYLIDLGPEGGDSGGYLVASGSPEEVAACKTSYTGQYLKGLL